jgi:hypothetical protein
MSGGACPYAVTQGPVQNDTPLIALDYGWRESHSLLTATPSGSGAAAPTGLLPPPLGPPLRGGLTPVPLVQREYHLPPPPSWMPVTAC